MMIALEGTLGKLSRVLSIFRENFIEPLNKKKFTDFFFQREKIS